MNYPKTSKYDYEMLKKKIMGPNPLKLTEELLQNHSIPDGALVMDLGSGTGLTSVFLAKEYGFKTYAADLWSDPEENKKFFKEMGVIPGQVIPVKADANDLPFEKDFFDAVVSVDSYNYFGRDENYLDKKLIPFVKKGSYLYISVPGMKKDCHNNLPKDLLLSWTPEQLAYLRDKEYWKKIMSTSKDAEIICIKEMETNENAWKDWLECEHEYAIGDRKSMNAGAGKYINFISIVMRKK